MNKVKKVYSSRNLGTRCNDLLSSINQKIVIEIMQKHNLTSYEEAYLLFIRSLDTSTVKTSIIEASNSIKQNFKYSVTN